MAQQKPSRGNRSSPHQRKRRKASAQHRTSTHSGLWYGNPADWRRFRTRTLPLILLVVITILAYANAWPDTLVGDDTTFAVSDRFSGLGLAGMARYFSEDVWAVTGFDSGLYRPLLLLSIMLDARLFGDWAAGYHLVNILLHVLTTLLVYGFVRYLLGVSGGQSTLSGPAALLAAVVFGVHPIHTEAVNSIFNRSEILVSLGVIGGLWWFLRTRETQPKKAWGGLSLIYLLVLLCRESGAMLPALAVALLWFMLPGNWWLRLRKSIPVLWLLIPLGIYLVLRANALAAPDLPPATQLPAIAPASGITELADAVLGYDPGRLPQAVRLWADSLKMMLWPHPLLFYHGKPETGFAVALALQLTLLGAALAGFIYQRPGLITGLAFFYIALLPSSGLIGAAVHPQLAERCLYLPSVGMAIALAFGLRWLAQRFTLRAALAPVVIVAALLTPLTWARNTQWSSDVLLAESDYRRGSQSGHILQALVENNLTAKNYFRAVEICDLHASGMKIYWPFSINCGSAYARVGRYREAEQAFFLAIESKAGTAKGHFNLARMYTKLGRKDVAKEQFEQAIVTSNQPFLREFHTGYMLIELYPDDRARLLEAKTHFAKSLDLQPQYFPARRLLEQINQILRQAGRFDNSDRQ